MNKFDQPNVEELGFIKHYIIEKMDSLQRDVLHCLQHPFAPMPALLWCSSCLNLLGALLSGDPNNHHSKHTSEYMKKFMGYNQEQRELILQVFRHKLVHLAQPGPFFKYDRKVLTWIYVHEYTLDHLTLVEVSNPEPAISLPPWIEKPQIHLAFTLGITQFMQDIICSVTKSGGYLHELEINLDTFRQCRDAVGKIFKPEPIKREVTNTTVTKS